VSRFPSFLRRQANSSSGFSSLQREHFAMIASIRSRTDVPIGIRRADPSK
jgi:hypothetical protein